MPVDAHMNLDAFDRALANVAFGGPKRNRLFICATTSLCSVLVPVNGARLL